MDIGLVASKRHTAILLLILLALAVGGAISQLTMYGPHAEPESTARVRLYLQILAVQGTLFWYVWAGIRRAGGSVRQMLDAMPWSAARSGRYVGVAIAGWLLWQAAGLALNVILRLGADELRMLRQLLPRSAAERVLWVVISFGAAGFCEEFIYRGYLLKQFRALTGSVGAGIFLQALVYGAFHAALPWKVVISVTCLGLFLGGLAAWQKSLVPAMITHAGIALMGLFSPT